MTDIEETNNLDVSDDHKSDDVSIDEGKETDSCPDSELELSNKHVIPTLIISDSANEQQQDEKESVAIGSVKCFDPSKDYWEESDMENSECLKSLIYDKDEVSLKILDQLLIPHAISYIKINGIEDGFKVIKNMNVRGAPLIATVALLSLAVELESSDHDRLNMEQLVLFVQESCAYLLTSRPTAINLRNGLREIIMLVDRSVADEEQEVDELRHRIQLTAFNFYEREWDENDALLREATTCVESNREEGHKFTIMTICNTGALATSSLGTALGVIRKLYERGHLEMAYALETRPYNQGSRLTAFELIEDSIPFTLITDSMAAWTMKTKKIDAILVGADQIALNGDTANKIGTYMLSILAAAHNIPFYVVAPTSSINFDIENGKSIKIEERPAVEMITFNGLLTAPAKTPVFNPAFDITNAKFITAILTEKGCFRPNQLKKAVMEDV
uniref:Methylthioribose-1-phosphate isomerase n=1 Tax=Rhabditophanes sp. KR3021 TaxID=114890 RepID=A0AC35TFL2_9BILA